MRCHINVFVYYTTMGDHMQALVRFYFDFKNILQFFVLVFETEGNNELFENGDYNNLNTNQLAKEACLVLVNTTSDDDKITASETMISLEDARDLIRDDNANEMNYGTIWIKHNQWDTLSEILTSMIRIRTGNPRADFFESQNLTKASFCNYGQSDVRDVEVFWRGTNNDALVQLKEHIDYLD